MKKKHRTLTYISRCLQKKSNEDDDNVDDSAKDDDNSVGGVDEE